MNGKPGYISLKQSELDRSPHLAAEYIIHELAHFKFRAANAQMMDEVNRNDPTAYLNAYLLREAQAEALTDRAMSEMVNAGALISREEGMLFLNARRLRYDNTVREIRAQNPGIGDDALLDAYAQLWLPAVTGSATSPGTRLDLACQGTFEEIQRGRLTGEIPEICTNVRLAQGTEGNLPKAISVEMGDVRVTGAAPGGGGTAGAAGILHFIANNDLLTLGMGTETPETRRRGCFDGCQRAAAQPSSRRRRSIRMHQQSGDQSI